MQKITFIIPAISRFKIPGSSVLSHAFLFFDVDAKSMNEASGSIRLFMATTDTNEAGSAKEELEVQNFVHEQIARKALAKILEVTNRESSVSKYLVLKDKAPCSFTKTPWLIGTTDPYLIDRLQPLAKKTANKTADEVVSIGREYIKKHLSSERKDDDEEVKLNRVLDLSFYSSSVFLEPTLVDLRHQRYQEFVSAISDSLSNKLGAVMEKVAEKHGLDDVECYSDRLYEALLEQVTNESELLYFFKHLKAHPVLSTILKTNLNAEILSAPNIQ